MWWDNLWLAPVLVFLLVLWKRMRAMRRLEEHTAREQNDNRVRCKHGVYFYKFCAACGLEWLEDGKDKPKDPEPPATPGPVEDPWQYKDRPKKIDVEFKKEVEIRIDTPAPLVTRNCGRCGYFQPIDHPWYHSIEDCDLQRGYTSGPLKPEYRPTTGTDTPWYGDCTKKECKKHGCHSCPACASIRSQCNTCRSFGCHECY